MKTSNLFMKQSDRPNSATDLLCSTERHSRLMIKTLENDQFLPQSKMQSEQLVCLYPKFQHPCQKQSGLVEDRLHIAKASREF